MKQIISDLIFDLVTTVKKYFLFLFDQNTDDKQDFNGKL